MKVIKSHWKVATFYESALGEYMDTKKLLNNFLFYLSERLDQKIGEWREHPIEGRVEKGMFHSFLLGKQGVLEIELNDIFSIRAYFIEESNAVKFEKALKETIKLKLPKEMQEELLSNIAFVEAGLTI